MLKIDERPRASPFIEFFRTLKIRFLKSELLKERLLPREVCDGLNGVFQISLILALINYVITPKTTTPNLFYIS